MKKLIAKTSLTALALAMAVPMYISAPEIAVAQSRDAFVGGLVGGVIGGAIGSSRRRHYREPDVVYVQPRRRVIVEEPVVRRRGGTRAHIDWCLNRYRSYDVRSDTYVSYGGRVRPCLSPFN